MEARGRKGVSGDKWGRVSLGGGCGREGRWMKNGNI